MLYVLHISDQKQAMVSYLIEINATDMDFWMNSLLCMAYIGRNLQQSCMKNERTAFGKLWKDSFFLSVGI